jgi:hypothetical protein
LFENKRAAAKENISLTRINIQVVKQKTFRFSRAAPIEQNCC